MDAILYDSHGFDDISEEPVVIDNRKPMVYLAGPSLTKGLGMVRAWETEQLRNAGAKVYAPLEDESINDKANAVQEGLAERIVKNDTDGILASDIVVIDAHEHGQGTLVELGQLKGMRDMAEMVREAMDAGEVPFESAPVYMRVLDVINPILDKKVYAQNTDIRRANTKPQSGDRREYGVNQYVYGTVLELTDNHGFYTWEEIMKEVSEHASKG